MARVFSLKADLIIWFSDEKPHNGAPLSVGEGPSLLALQTRPSIIRAPAPPNNVEREVLPPFADSEWLSKCLKVLQLLNGPAGTYAQVF